MSDKYIIKNCPAFMKPSYCKNQCSYSIANERDSELTYKFEFDEDSKCQDCTDCVTKQIAIMCNYAIHGAKATGHFNFLGERILKLLDIQEVE